MNKNKRLFATDKEKAGLDFKELTNAEYNQLKIFHKLNQYKKLKNSELSSKNGYNKNDILWTIYNEQKNIYLGRKDYIMASVVYERMYEILKKEKRHQQALEFLICCLYLRVYDNFLYERHLLKYMSKLKDALKKNNIDTADFQYRYKFIIEDLKTIINKYLPFLYSENKASDFQQKINEFLNTI